MDIYHLAERLLKEVRDRLQYLHEAGVAKGISHVRHCQKTRTSYWHCTKRNVVLRLNLVDNPRLVNVEIREIRRQKRQLLVPYIPCRYLPRRSAFLPLALIPHVHRFKN